MVSTSKQQQQVEISNLKKHKYSAVPGFFIQDSPDFDPKSLSLLEDSFGLIDKSPERWSNLMNSIKKLNENSTSNVTYRFMIHARHNQGAHNVAEAYYGQEAWDEKWSLLDGDGEGKVWGPDPDLTEYGIAQTELVRLAWLKEIKEGIPLPQVLYSSPFRRSLTTLKITWRDILLKQEGGLRPIVREMLRERNGEHTCDKRSKRSELIKRYPNFDFDASVTEEDESWTLKRETLAEHIPRVQIALDEIFATDKNDIIYLATHSGTISAFNGVLGRREHFVPPGEFIPLVIRIEEE